METLNSEQMEALSEFLSSIWVGNDPFRHTNTSSVRYRQIGETAEAMFHCQDNARPKSPGEKQDIWDQQYVKSHLTLDLFFSPKDCVKVFLETHAGDETEMLSGVADNKSLVAEIRSVRRHIQPGTVSPKKNSYLDCTLEFPLKVRDLPDWAKERVDLNMKAHGVPEDLYPSKTDARISYIVHVLIENPCIADRTTPENNFRVPERDNPAVLRWSTDEDAKLGLCKEDAITFALTGEAKNLRIPENSEFYPEVAKAGLQNIGLGDLPEALQGSASMALERARVVTQDSVYLNHVMGISRLEEGQDENGVPVTTERFGRISFFAKSKGGFQWEGMGCDGLLNHCRDLLKKAETEKGLQEIGEMLVPGYALSKSQGFAPVRNAVQQEFLDKTKDLSSKELKDPRTLDKALFADLEDSTSWTPLMGSVMQGTCIGVVPASVIKGTAADRNRGNVLKSLLNRFGNRTQDSKSR